MNLSKIIDIKELKALAYDQILQKETAQININMINQRITELSNLYKKHHAQKRVNKAFEAGSMDDV